MAQNTRSYAVIGLNVFGKKVLDLLSEKGMHVIAIDLNEHMLDKYKDIAGINAVALDATDEGALRKVGVDEVDVAVVAFGSDIAASILVTSTLKSLGVSEIIARAINPQHVRALKRVGSTRVVFPDEDMAERVGRSIITPGVREFIEMANHFDIAQIEVPGNLVGKTLGELNLNDAFGINVLAVKHRLADEEGTAKEESVAEFAKDEYVLNAKDILLVAGEESKLEKLENELSEL